MKTLIFDGSPHRAGDTAALLAALQETLPGEKRIVRAYEAGIAPCLDCRFCQRHPACAQKDGMEEVYRWIEKSDAVVIASPLYFSQLTGPLLSLLSRLQAFYCARRFLGRELAGGPKRGGLLLVGGGDGSPDPAVRTARCLLRLVNAADIAPAVLSLKTDLVPAAQDAAALAAARELGEFLKKGFV